MFVYYVNQKKWRWVFVPFRTTVPLHRNECVWMVPGTVNPED